MKRKFRPGVLVERIGTEVLILCETTGETHRLAPEFSDTVDALLAGKDASKFEVQISTLEGLGLLEVGSQVSPTRRQAVTGFAGLIGAGAVTLALPTAALASSASFAVSNSLFGWADGARAGGVGFEVGNIAVLDSSIFTLGSSWTITVDTGSDIGTATDTVQDDGAGGLLLAFDFPGAALSSGTGLVLLGRLAGRGLTSNQFQISEFIPPAP